MSPIAELTITQMQIMSEVARSMPTFLMGLPNDTDDDDTMRRLAGANSETDQLVSLGFLDDVTKHSQGMMELMEKASGRKNRVFHITEMGRAFFDASTSQAIN